jgi:type III secretion protein C
VHVPDKHFLVLSGMINDNETHYKSSIPCLGGLPLIGAAFSNNNRSRTKNNVIIFVRPHIINSFADYVRLTDRQEEKYEESAFLPTLQEAFQAGVDLVKTPENE